MKAAPMTQKPPFPLMTRGDVPNTRHLQMPLWLFADPRYQSLALETKVAYTFLLDRFHLSRRNGWVNEDGAVFLLYTRRSLADEMQVSYRKIIAAMKELSAAGLIWEKRCGRGSANQIYLALVERAEAKDRPAPRERASAPASQVPERHVQKGESRTSGSAEPARPEVPDRHPSQTEASHTDLIDTESSPSVAGETGRADGEPPEKEGPSGMSEPEQLAQILNNCELWVFDPETARVFANAIERLFYSDSLRIGKAVLPRANVRSRLWDLDAVILQSVQGKLRSNQRQVKNSTAYTMAVLFNTICEAHSDLLVDPYLNGGGAPPEPG